MPKTKDILSKIWLRRASDGILSRRLCGGKIAEHLPTEQPQISNRQVDMLVRNDQGVIQHVEFQSTNELEFPFRMLDYWVYFRREYNQRVSQCVFYIGKEPMRLEAMFAEDRTTHGFDIVNLQDYEAADLLASPDWGDNLWALGAKGDRAVVLGEILSKLRAMTGEEQESALAELAAFSLILKLEELLTQKLKEIPMLTIDLRESAVIRPLIEEAEQHGRQEGRLEGRQEGRQDQLVDLLTEKFGPLPSSVIERVHSASAEQVNRWARRVLRANTLEEAFE